MGWRHLLLHEAELRVLGRQTEGFRDGEVGTTESTRPDGSAQGAAGTPSPLFAGTFQGAAAGNVTGQDLRFLSSVHRPRHMSLGDLRKVASNRDKAQKAERDFHLAILAAHRAGETYRDIGRFAGLSHQRCQEIVKKLIAEGE